MGVGYILFHGMGGYTNFLLVILLIFAPWGLNECSFISVHTLKEYIEFIAIILAIFTPSLLQEKPTQKEADNLNILTGQSVLNQSSVDS